jgi:HEAT repeat protein
MLVADEWASPPFVAINCEGYAMRADQKALSIDNLIDLLQDADAVVRIHAGFVLGTMGEDAISAVWVLIGMLKFGEVQGRKLAASTLGQIGPVASEAIPALLEAANDEDDGLADMATWALEEIDLAEEDDDEGLAEAA